MRKSALVLLLAITLPLLAAAPGDAWHGRGHVFIGVGPAWWGYPYWWYPPPYYAYPPPPAVVQEPPVYVQQQPPAPAYPAGQAEWYYCPSARQYYPNVPTCPEAWIRVPARSQ
jgi:hypothetical protein